jgi:Zn-dependent M28 family amino/carboxypeptidase
MSTQPRRLRLEQRATNIPTETANVIGDNIGYDPSQYVVIAAHYDSQWDCVGACDNATGLAVLFEVARAWSQLPLRVTVVFAAFADEEHGGMGAADYCRRHSVSLGKTLGMVNLDALAWAHLARRALHADPSIADFARHRASATGWEPEVEIEASSFGNGDHRAFIDAGVPACWLWRHPPNHPYYHTRGDTPDQIDFDLVAETGTAAASVAFGLAQEELDLGRSRPSRRCLDF